LYGSSAYEVVKSKNTYIFGKIKYCTTNTMAFFLQPEYLHSATAIFPKQIKHHYSNPTVKPTRCTSVSNLFNLE
jgi:hypothetical protein